MGIKSIWENEFFQNYRPVPKWAFKFAYNNQTDDILSQAICSVNVGKRDVSVINTYFLGVQANSPGRVQNAGELNITFNENINYAITTELEAMFAETSHDSAYFDTSTGYRQSGKTENKIKIFLLNPYDGLKAVYGYEFYNVFLTAINEETFEYTSKESECLKRTVRFSYDYMKTLNVENYNSQLDNMVPKNNTSEKLSDKYDGFDSVVDEYLQNENGKAIEAKKLAELEKQAAENAEKMEERIFDAKIKNETNVKLAEANANAALKAANEKYNEANNKLEQAKQSLAELEDARAAIDDESISLSEIGVEDSLKTKREILEQQIAQARADVEQAEEEMATAKNEYTENMKAVLQLDEKAKIIEKAEKEKEYEQAKLDADIAKFEYEVKVNEINELHAAGENTDAEEKELDELEIMKAAADYELEKTSEELDELKRKPLAESSFMTAEEEQNVAAAKEAADKQAADDEKQNTAAEAKKAEEEKKTAGIAASMDATQQQDYAKLADKANDASGNNKTANDETPSIEEMINDYSKNWNADEKTKSKNVETQSNNESATVTSQPATSSVTKTNEETRSDGTVVEDAIYEDEPVVHSEEKAESNKNNYTFMQYSKAKNNMENVLAEQYMSEGMSPEDAFKKAGNDVLYIEKYRQKIIDDAIKLNTDEEEAKAKNEKNRTNALSNIMYGGDRTPSPYIDIDTPDLSKTVVGIPNTAKDTPMPDRGPYFK